MSTEDELRNCRQGKRILKKRVAELEREVALLKAKQPPPTVADGTRGMDRGR